MKKGKVAISIVLLVALSFVVSACPPRRHRPPRRVIVVPFAQVVADRIIIANV